MSESRHYWLILLVVLFSGLSSGTATASKYLCQGDNVQLFQNVTFSNGNIVNLYINGLRKTLISTWHSLQNNFILDGYKEKVSLDEYGNIWIRNIQLADNGTYLLQYNTDIMKSEVQIYVMVAPTYFCKPKIEKTDSLLIASLTEDCGRPSAHVQWLEYPEILNIRQDIVKLPPENEAGTYYACAESPALRCVKNLNISNYCTGFTIKRNVTNQAIETKIGKDIDNSPPVSSEISHLKTVTYVMVTIVSITVLIMAVKVIIILKRRMCKGTKDRASTSKEVTNLATETKIGKDKDLRNVIFEEETMTGPGTKNFTDEKESYLLENKNRASSLIAQNASHFGKTCSRKFNSDPFPVCKNVGTCRIHMPSTLSVCLYSPLRKVPD